MSLIRVKAIEAIRSTTRRHAASFPPKADPAWVEQVYRPEISPSFSVRQGDKIFTVGSCFARNIERRLENFDVPTRSIVTPVEEWLKWDFNPGNSILNEYNPGTMAQRITQSFLGPLDVNNETIVLRGEKYDDLMLHAFPVRTIQRAIERRTEVDNLYTLLPQSSALIVTLGLVECWYDNKVKLYLNKMPDLRLIQASPERYEFRRLDLDTAYELLSSAFALLQDAGINVVLTVSPVPLGKTFSGDSAVTANSFSKSLLRVCADMLTRQFNNVDYFPSYEMVTMNGTASFIADNVHVQDAVVQQVTSYMIEQYAEI